MVGRSMTIEDTSLGVGRDGRELAPAQGFSALYYAVLTITVRVMLA